MAFLVMQREGHTLQYDLAKTITLGRGSQSEILIPSAKASRQHARILVQNGIYTLQDLDSSNGTYLNDARVQSQLLTHGDIIRIGNVTLTFLEHINDPLLGRRLGHYHILQQIGQGGMGTIYRANQVGLNREVALKVMKKELAETPGFVDDFFREARLSGNLEHPNMIHVYDADKDGGYYYLSMEFVRGETLSDRLDRLGRIPPMELAQICAAVCDGLAYAHGHQITHQDIKPQNIMITDTGVIKIADLGLAKVMQYGEDQSPDRPAMGTPLYIPPEVIRKSPPDSRSDLYSLAATMYHLLTGEPPYMADKVREIVRMHLEEPVPDPRAIVEEIPEDLSKLVMQAMSKDPARRPATATDFASLLREISNKPQPQVNAPEGKGKAASVRRKTADTVKRVHQDTARTKIQPPKPKSIASTLALVGLLVVAAAALVWLLVIRILPSDEQKRKAAALEPEPTVIEPAPVVEVPAVVKEAPEDQELGAWKILRQEIQTLVEADSFAEASVILENRRSGFKSASVLALVSSAEKMIESARQNRAQDLLNQLQRGSENAQNSMAMQHGLMDILSQYSDTPAAGVAETRLVAIASGQMTDYFALLNKIRSDLQNMQCRGALDKASQARESAKGLVGADAYEQLYELVAAACEAKAKLDEVLDTGVIWQPKGKAEGTLKLVTTEQGQLLQWSDGGDPETVTWQQLAPTLWLDWVVTQENVSVPACLGFSLLSMVRQDMDSAALWLKELDDRNGGMTELELQALMHERLIVAEVSEPAAWKLNPSDQWVIDAETKQILGLDSGARAQWRSALWKGDNICLSFAVDQGTVRIRMSPQCPLAVECSKNGIVLVQADGSRQKLDTETPIKLIRLSLMDMNLEIEADSQPLGAVMLKEPVKWILPEFEVVAAPMSLDGLLIIAGP